MLCMYNEQSIFNTVYSLYLMNTNTAPRDVIYKYSITVIECISCEWYKEARDYCAPIHKHRIERLV